MKPFAIVQDLLKLVVLHKTISITIVLSAKNLIESSGLLSFWISRKYTVQGDTHLFFQVAPTYWPPARDLLGRSDPHRMLDYVQKRQGASMLKLVARKK